ncbi:hypothetical protein LEP1GSC103_3409 [Leptospira borgpetersenii serovar Javanica str. UI 09931]|uniref:Uncharacterized protein n=1 Tax=Leptospira borgpetersenii serovar Javanica str. UI 09931 TaxID=1049767 RepID=A0AAV3JGB5_LEPBO|nr:hypothetical protein LEP1GSC090_3465 [Leptospira borgpetersenii serovar Javanica str. MK146]EPG59143.1 hypothetical protein LEP1GSC103_3409 [Leptospira borgpetersenii serovar Javanica str. UI 09931]
MFLRGRYREAFVSIVLISFTSIQLKGTFIKSKDAILKSNF